MQYDRKKLQWLEFDLFSQLNEITHAVFTRHGGVSKEKYDSLNFSASIGDNSEHVKVNREVAREFLEVNQIVFAKQVHGNHIEEVTLENQDKIPAADGLFTRLKGVALAITHADCQAAIIYDPKNEVVAAAHAGWKGLVQNIYGELIQTLIDKVGSNPKDLIVGVSPSLGPDHAEFVDFQKEFPKSFWDYQVKPNHFDLRAIGEKQLLDAGISKNNIEISSICTYSQKDEYFSYRREKKTGRNATMIAMKPASGF